MQPTVHRPASADVPARPAVTAQSLPVRQTAITTADHIHARPTPTADARRVMDQAHTIRADHAAAVHGAAARARSAVAVAVQWAVVAQAVVAVAVTDDR